MRQTTWAIVYALCGITACTGIALSDGASIGAAIATGGIMAFLVTLVFHITSMSN